MKNNTKNILPLIKLGHSLQNTSLDSLVTQAYLRNHWFTPQNVHSAIDALIQEFLSEQKLSTWLEKYNTEPTNPQKIGVVMAGNIPAVGFHDLVCVLASGHHLMAKLSQDDRVLMLYFIEKLIEIEPSWASRITLAERLNAADAYIATGSDNTARYFEYYFSKKPHIIRRNRTSVGILTGHETPDDLAALGHDILQYFGLGCRNVAKVYVPEGYDFRAFYEAIEPLQDTYRNHHKYFNNYEYNKSVYLVNREPHFDNGFLIARQSEALVSPIAVLFYETYQNQEDLTQKIASQNAKIQCIVSKNGWYEGSLPLGQAQTPSLFDYADGVDTMKFLEGLGR
ncbi:MAG: acyl-CoA reductase [Runella sp.]